MNTSELLFGLFVVVALLVLALFFGWRQIQTLRKLRREDLPVDDEQYLRARALRRLFCSGLMLLAALLLIGSYVLDTEYRQFTQDVKNHAVSNQKTVPTPEQKGFLRRFTMYWVFTLLVLCLFLLVAVLDIRATLRYGLTKHRQLREDYRDELNQELKRLRQERNGQ